MSSPQRFYFLLQETTNNSKYSWRREYLKLTLGGKRDKLEKVIEYEDKTIYRPTGLAFGLPYQVRRSTKLEYTQALLRFRKDAADRKRLAELERQLRKDADKKLNGVRGMDFPTKPLPAPARVAMVADTVPAAGLFDDFVVVDTEYQGAFLLEVAAIRYKNWQPVGQPFKSYVRFTDWLWPKTTELTGITAHDVARAPTEGKVLADFLAFAGTSLLVAHNVGADRSKFEAARLRQRYPEPLPNKWFCTMALARARETKGTPCGLGDLCQRFGFSRHGAHQALRDVEMCFQVLRHYHQEDPITSLDPKARKAAPTLFAPAA
jgi:DNA polymerase III epsilon subunit-like protein